MGIGIVLLIWAIVGSVLAGVGAVVVGGATDLLTKRAKEKRGKVVLAASLFPFTCLVWAGLVFVFQAAVNSTVLHRDPGLGDTWECPLPNGYQLLMIDVTDYGLVYNPKTQGWDEGVGDRDDAISGVRLLQVSGRYIIGGADRGIPEDVAKNNDHVDFYFLMDTGADKYTTFASYEELHSAALQLGIQPKLQPFEDVYQKYRFTWFDALAGLLLCVPPLSAAWLLMRRILRLRRTPDGAPQTAP
jgi:hypothetical protein